MIVIRTRGRKRSRPATPSTPGYQSDAPGRGSLGEGGLLPAAFALVVEDRAHEWFGPVCMIRALRQRTGTHGSSFPRSERSGLVERGRVLRPLRPRAIGLTPWPGL